MADGSAFECEYDLGSGAGEIEVDVFTLYVVGTDNADDIDAGYSSDVYFHNFIVYAYDDNDRVICPDDVDTVSLTMGSGDDWVECWVDSCATVGQPTEERTCVEPR